MIGQKIAITGLIFIFISFPFIHGKWPGAAIGAPLLVAFFIGLIAVVVGLIIAVWE